jgi:peptide/nickel transport system permease protein
VETRRYVIGKVARAALTLAFVVAFNFFLFRVMPGNPATLLLRGTSALTPAIIEELEHELGLDQPLAQQFVTYVKNTFTGQFGVSLAGATPVTECSHSR